MFRKLYEIDQRVTVFVDGDAQEAEVHDTVAAVLFRQGPVWSRTTPLSGERRAPFCMMGVCFDCLATVEGKGTVQTCLVTVEDGMRIERLIGTPQVEL